MDRDACMIIRMKKTVLLCLILLIFMLLSFQSHSKAPHSRNEIPIGVVFDMHSLVGETVHRCITIAVSEFYEINSDYQTRILFHFRDTNGKPMHALSAALDLLENYKVKAIIGSESTAEAKLLAALGDEARVPVLSFSPRPSSKEYPYFLQISQDEMTQFKAIAAMAGLFRWKNVILIHEDNDDGREIVAYLTDESQEKSMHITYKSLILTSSSNEHILEGLYKLGTMRAEIFVIHTQPSLASCLLLNAAKIGLIGEGYKWIITSKTMNFLDLMDDEVINSMQGAVGFKSYIPASRGLQNFSLTRNKQCCIRKHTTVDKEINTYGVWAYDAVSALAMSIEKVQADEQVTESNIKSMARTGSAEGDTMLLRQMLKTTFYGLGGEFQLMNGKVATKALEIVNVIDKKQRKIGFWTTKDSFTKEIGKAKSFLINGLEDIIWPGVASNIIPKHRRLQMRGKKLKVAVSDIGFEYLISLNYDHQTGSATVSGFCGDVFNSAFSELKLGVDIEFIRSVGTVDDLINKVNLGVYDAAIGDITITANRSRFVDFTLPFTDLGVGTLTRDGKGSMWIFLDPISKDLWITSAGFFLLLGFVIWIIEHRTNKDFQGSAGQQIGTTLAFAFSTLVYAHREKLQSNLSRFVVTVWLFVVLVLTSSYTATLSSHLTVKQINLASEESYIGYQAGSFVWEIINSNLKFSGTPYQSAQDFAKALSLGSKKGGVDAIIDEIPYIKEFLSKYPSGYSMIDTQAITNGFGFVFPKGSSLAPDMSTQIARLRQDGTLKLLEHKWFVSRSNTTSQDSMVSNPRPKITLDMLRGLFLISGISMVLALSIFMLYIVHEKVCVMTKGKLAIFIIKYILRIPTTTNATVQDNEIELSHY